MVCSSPCGKTDLFLGKVFAQTEAAGFLTNLLQLQNRATPQGWRDERRMEGADFGKYQDSPTTSITDVPVLLVRR
jgi:hypothetical protein